MAPVIELLADLRRRTAILCMTDPANDVVTAMSGQDSLPFRKTCTEDAHALLFIEQRNDSVSHRKRRAPPVSRLLDRSRLNFATHRDERDQRQWSQKKIEQQTRQMLHRLSQHAHALPHSEPPPQLEPANHDCSSAIRTLSTMFVLVNAEKPIAACISRRRKLSTSFLHVSTIRARGT